MFHGTSLAVICVLLAFILLERGILIKGWSVVINPTFPLQKNKNDSSSILSGQLLLISRLIDSVILLTVTARFATPTTLATAFVCFLFYVRRPTLYRHLTLRPTSTRVAPNFSFFISCFLLFSSSASSASHSHIILASHRCQPVFCCEIYQYFRLQIKRSRGPFPETLQVSSA